MTARLRDPECRRWPLIAAVALVLLLAMAMAAGCIEPGYQPDHDLVVIKLSPDGSLEWSKIIDKGGDDHAGPAIPVSDGASLISINYDSLIQLSRDGTIAWEKEYKDPLCTASALTGLHDGRYIVGSSGNGVVCKIGKTGDLIWNKSAVRFDSEMTSGINAIKETDDGGFVVAGNYLTRLDPEGRPLWQRSYDTHDGIPGYQTIVSITETQNGEFLGLARKYGELYLLQFDKNGTITRNSSLGLPDKSSGLMADSTGYVLLLFDPANSSVEKIELNSDGMVTQRHAPFNTTVQNVLLNNPGLITKDGGYFIAILQNPDAKTDIREEIGKIGVGGMKLKPDGTTEWSNISLTFCKPLKTTTNIKLSTVIQTSDGGYLILGLRDNFWKC